MPYIYNKTENKIVEVPSYGKPTDSNSTYRSLCEFGSDEQIEEYHELYENNIASLKYYPCHPSCIQIWNDNQKVYDSDFELKQDCRDDSTPPFDSFCFHCSRSNGCGAPIIAIPLQLVDNIWDDFFDMWYKEYHDSPHTPRWEAILKLQEHFDIIRK